MLFAAARALIPSGLWFCGHPSPVRQPCATVTPGGVVREADAAHLSIPAGQKNVTGCTRSLTDSAAWHTGCVQSGRARRDQGPPQFSADCVNIALYAGLFLLGILVAVVLLVGLLDILRGTPIRSISRPGEE